MNDKLQQASPAACNIHPCWTIGAKPSEILHYVKAACFRVQLACRDHVISPAGFRGLFRETSAHPMKNTPTDIRQIRAEEREVTGRKQRIPPDSRWKRVKKSAIGEVWNCGTGIMEGN
jgi:hypothetical protein